MGQRVARAAGPGVRVLALVRFSPLPHGPLNYALALTRVRGRDYVAGTTHKTILGDIKFAGSENVGTAGSVSQWQNGEFEVVWPPKMATAKLNPVKPAWK